MSDCNNYIFEDIEHAYKMIEGAYKKLKSHLYFDKTLVFAKKRLAYFESNRTQFENDLKQIAVNLSQQNHEYFDKLIEQIDYVVLPKKFDTTSQESNIVNCAEDHEKKISRVNFFIDMPIELSIIDFLWTILIGKITTEKPHMLRFAAATSIKKSVYSEGTDLFSNVDYESNRFFEPYFNLYSKWRNSAFRKINDVHEQMSTLLICLDLKSFYYSVEFDFDRIQSYFPSDERLNSLLFLTDIIRKIYFKYTEIVSKQKKGIKNKKNTCIFPIGTVSSYILRELYLYDFDTEIYSTLKPLYYSRYVDDILLVIENDDYSISSDEVIRKHFIEKGLIIESGTVDMRFIGYNNIRIQKDKINCFSFSKEQKTILLDIYAEAINMNSSEANLLPDVDVLSTSFTQKAYSIQNLEISQKIRDLGFLRNNNYNATRFINAILRLKKNAYVDKQTMSHYFDQIEDFYSGSQGVEYSNNWRSLFELYLLCGESDRARKFYKNIYNKIESIDFTIIDNNEILEKSKKRVLKHLKNDLKSKLEISAGLTAALNFSFGKTKTVKNLALAFRRSNMLNHTAVAFPLLNYSSISNVSLTNYDINTILSSFSKAFILDQFMLKWTPRFINSNEFYIAEFLYNLSYSKKTYDPNVVDERFVKYNHLGNYAIGNYKYSYEEGLVRCHKVEINNCIKRNPKIALVNTKIDKSNVLNAITNPKENLSWDAKAKLFKILNAARDEKADILVFPEFYLPVAWLMDISIFAIKSRITIITGLQYIVSNDVSFNNLCTVNPTTVGHSFQTGFIQFREKNFYSPEEIISLAHHKQKCKDAEIPSYNLISNGTYTYSSILCYEFTDISSRAAMKSKVEMLFVPQLNKDTNYFSSIVESSARDLHCFIIQANTSEYGDSRITAPYNTEHKNIFQIKGGENDAVLTSTVDIEALISRRGGYQKYLASFPQKCSKCHHQRSLIECDKCILKLKDGHIKGTPPNYD